MSEPYSKPSSSAVAHHEAAHAVAHIVLGLPGKLEYIELDDQEPRGGRTEIDRPDWTPPLPNQVIDCIVQALVGAAAEAKIDGDWGIAQSGAEKDYEDAKGYAYHFEIPEDLQSWEAKASVFVGEHWQQIQTVAAKLLAQQPIEEDKKRLGWEAITKLCGKS